ncbi:MAG TPA: segregation/condensation protein A [Anaerolineales bacterium]|nr:segregation/condensation protein A [Anaerolineales bacterium]
MSTFLMARDYYSYEVSTPVFEGPLDLLLYLIEKAELDITKLALAQVTDQYLDHLRKLEELTPDEVSEFLVIAAKLLQIKSEALLPRPPEREEGEEDPGELLARQLLEYQRYKTVAEGLFQREAMGMRNYLRLAPPPRMESKVDLSEISLEDLVAAAASVLLHLDNRHELRTVVTPSPITIRQKIRFITETLKKKGRASFRALLATKRTRLDVVVTFLAVLELVKQHFVQAYQARLFDEIELETTNEMFDAEDLELEFGE